mmetsp:Transcript_58505/g.174215  ORF Transcript_58505/g.174215 Transcript_58505/m.174215 type:complete len:949 (-) Transcript_58505:905-3751(-)
MPSRGSERYAPVFFSIACWVVSASAVVDVAAPEEILFPPSKIVDEDPAGRALEDSSGAGLLKLVDSGWCGRNERCDVCEGDCGNDDSLCLEGLQCFERRDNEAVPGCNGEGERKVDYCYRPEADGFVADTADPVTERRVDGAFFVRSRRCDKKRPCGLCEGDCERDNDACGPGFVCLERNGNEAVPGCAGEGENKVDYCYRPELKYRYQCHEKFPCGMCQGDCDDDLGCLPGLRCYQRETDEPVPGCTGDGNTRVDYCYDPRIEDVKDDSKHPPNATSLTYMFDCDEESLCGKCTGECKDDFGCALNLRCFERNRKQEVPGCEGDGNRGMNYCYDPADADTPIPTLGPSRFPTEQPTKSPQTLSPTDMPTPRPTTNPTVGPTSGLGVVPTVDPTDLPTLDSTKSLTDSPDGDPTGLPSAGPSLTHSASPTTAPSGTPSASPSLTRSAGPISGPSGTPSLGSSSTPSSGPTSESSVTPSSSPPVPLPTASTASAPAQQQTVVVPLSPMVMELTFFVSRRRVLSSTAIAVDEAELRRITKNAITESFQGVYSLFTRLDLTLQSYGMLEVATNATVSYGLGGNVYFLEAPNWKLPSQEDVDKTAMGSLDEDEFLSMLQESRDPVLSSVWSVEIALLTKEEEELEETEETLSTAETQIGGGNNAAESNTTFKALLTAAIIVSFATILALGVFLYKRSQNQKWRSDKAVPTSIPVVNTMSSSEEPDQHSLPEVAAYIMHSHSVDESELSTDGWSLTKGHVQGMTQNSFTGTVHSSREAAPQKEEGYVYEDNRSVGNRSADRSFLTLGTDGMSATGMARMDGSILDINDGYDDGTVGEVSSAEKALHKDWIRKRGEIEKDNIATGEYRTDDWLEKRREIIEDAVNGTNAGNGTEHHRKTKDCVAPCTTEDYDEDPYHIENGNIASNTTEGTPPKGERDHNGDNGIGLTSTGVMG